MPLPFLTSLWGTTVLHTVPTQYYASFLKENLKKSGTSSRGQKLTFLILLETLFGNFGK